MCVCIYIHEANITNINNCLNGGYMVFHFIIVFNFSEYLKIYTI